MRAFVVMIEDDDTTSMLWLNDMPITAEGVATVTPIAQEEWIVVEPQTEHNPSNLWRLVQSSEWLAYLTGVRTEYAYSATGWEASARTVAKRRNGVVE